jgi:hypothetical protein
MWCIGGRLLPASSAQVLLIVALPRAGVRPLRRETRWLRAALESGCLGMQPKAGGKLHLRLNTGTSPIADKYREGKLKRTLKREFKST